MFPFLTDEAAKEERMVGNRHQTGGHVGVRAEDLLENMAVNG